MANFTRSAYVATQGHENHGNALETDPVALGLMQGIPVPAERQVRWDDGSMWRFPQFRWGYSHMRELVPTVNIPRAFTIAELPRTELTDLDAVRFTTLEGQSLTWIEALAATYTDAIVILHRGTIVYERWFGATTPVTQHILFSVTKSFVGTLAETLIDEGKLNEDLKAQDYVTELNGSGLGNATIRQILDMRTGLDFSEDYVPGRSGFTDIQRMSMAGGWGPRPTGYTGPDGHYAFLASLKQNAPHGGDFVYRTPNTNCLQWIIERITGQSLAQQITTRYWQKLGMEQDAALGVDRLGTGFGGGGLMASLRDIARFGEMLRLGGIWPKGDGFETIVPSAAVARIFKGGDPAAFIACQYTGNLDGSYGSQWWHRAGGQVMAAGVHGQGIYIDRKAELVIARLGSHPVATNRGNAPVTMPAYDAITAVLAG